MVQKIKCHCVIILSIVHLGNLEEVLEYRTSIAVNKGEKKYIMASKGTSMRSLTLDALVTIKKVYQTTKREELFVQKGIEVVVLEKNFIL
jgi:hypothetical protein